MKNRKHFLLLHFFISPLHREPKENKRKLPSCFPRVSVLCHEPSQTRYILSYLYLIRRWFLLLSLISLDYASLCLFGLFIWYFYWIAHHILLFVCLSYLEMDYVFTVLWAKNELIREISCLKNRKLREFGSLSKIDEHLVKVVVCGETSLCVVTICLILRFVSFTPQSLSRLGCISL